MAETCRLVGKNNAASCERTYQVLNDADLSDNLADKLAAPRTLAAARRGVTINTHEEQGASGCALTFVRS